MTYTSSRGDAAEYHNTVLFKSDSPFDFGNFGGTDDGPIARLAAHAPGYLKDPETEQWYITCAGWPDERLGTVIPGSVAIRELDWRYDI